MLDKILLLGDPRLRIISETATDFNDPSFIEDIKILQKTLECFRLEYGFGRGIAAPQIGQNRRVIALNINDAPFVMINPEITWKSLETFTKWDDCMCFPTLLVKVQRHCSITVRYFDEKGNIKEWKQIDQSISELLQHEIDHLNGILATDLALDKDSIIYKDVYESMPEFFINSNCTNFE